MELCQGSLLDYCRKTLDEMVASHVKAIDIMWQITCGLDYLQRHKIDPGDLKLENVLFWKKDSKSRRVVVKLTGYGYNYHLCEENIKIDPSQIARLFHSAATKNEANPKWPISLDSLTEIDYNRRSVALNLISFCFLNDGSSNRFEVNTLLQHPLFTQCNEDARSKLINQMMGKGMGHTWKDEQKLQKWKTNLDKKDFANEDFEDLKETLLSFDNTPKIMSEAFKTTPRLFADYIWYHATVIDTLTPQDKNQIQPVETQNVLGEGTFTTVIKRDYIDKEGMRYEAAFKKCKRNTDPEIEAKFNKEIEKLRQLNHLFVVKYIDVVVENYSEKYIVMELCDGSLKDYVEGKLELIPKDLLDDKILISQVALGLADIHDKGIIHKDLNLENILLKLQSPRLVLAKIAEIGFLKQLNKTMCPGNENNMAPELLNAPDGVTPFSFASDVYDLGITIAQIVLKGEHPSSSNSLKRKVFIANSLIPSKLQGLGWDLKDLILKLTDKDPGKRPNMFLVLSHPYFALTNDRTKKHFVDQLWDQLNLLSNQDRSKQIKKLFNDRNFQGWYNSFTGEKPATKEKIEEMSKTLQFLKNLNQENFEPNVKAEILSSAKKHGQMTNKEAIKSEYDPFVENEINQKISINLIRSRFRGLSRYRLEKWIESSPKFLVPYIWSTCLHDVLTRSLADPSSGPIVTPTSPGGTEIKHTITSELKWSSLFLDKEVVDELWNIKYSENYQHSPEILQEIIKTVGKCSISEKVWFALLEKIGTKHGLSLLSEVVASHSSHAPKVAQIILQRLDVSSIPEQIHMLVASNEGDWAANIMQILLNHGIDLSNAVNSIGMTPVHYAAQNESSSGPKLMKLLLENGGNPNTRSTGLEKSTPVHLAASNQGNYAAEILKLLLDNGGSWDTRDGQFEPIHLATMNNSESAPLLLDLLIKKRGINVINKRTGMSLVHFAVFNNGDSGPNIVKILLENGADPNTCGKGNQTPLHLAARDNTGENNQIEIMKVFLENGGDPDAIDRWGKTPVHYAAANKGEYAQRKLSLLLSHRGKLVITKDNNDQNPIVVYSYLNKVSSGKELKKLVDEKKPPNSTLDNPKKTQIDNGESLGCSPIDVVVAEKALSFELDIVELWLKKGGDPNLPDNENLYTRVHYAASSLEKWGPRQMEILLDNGGNANAIGQEGYTPLHLAAMNPGIYGLQLTIILLDRGGDPNAVDKFGRSPVHLAVLNKNEQIALEIILQLLKQGGNANACDKRGRTPLHYAVFKVLLENWTNDNSCYNKKQMPLHPAARHNMGENQIAIMTAFLENGGNPNAVDELGKTPVHYAAANKGEYSQENLSLFLYHGGKLGAIKDYQNGNLASAFYLNFNKKSSEEKERELLGEKQRTNFSIDNKSGEETLRYSLVNGRKNTINLVQTAFENEENANEISLGCSPIHATVAENTSSLELDIVELLLKKEGNPNLPNNQNQHRQVYFAASSLKNWGPREMEILLGNGGNVNAIGKEGFSPLHLAAMNPGINGPRLTRMLLERGGNPNAMDKFGRTPVHLAVLNENDSIAKETILHLLKQGGNANARDKKGRTPLHYAIAEKPYSSLKDILRQYGGNILQRDNHGMTPFRLRMNISRKVIHFDS